MFDNPKRQYYLQLRQRVEEYCKDLRKKLQVFPNKIMRGASHLDIPDDEMMYYKNNSYSLKVQVKDCLKIYKFLQKKTKVNEYEKYFSIYKKECQGKKNVEEYKTAYNTAEMELVKEFNAQRDLLYRAVTIMKALTNYLKKKDGKEDDNKENVQSVEEYVNDIDDMDLYFTEKEEVMNHHFIPTSFTFESYMPYDDVNIVPRKAVNKLSLDSYHDNVTRMYGRPLKIKLVKGQRFEDKYHDMKIQYNTLTEKIFYVKAKLGDKIIINKRPYQNDYKKLISSLDLVKIAIGTYANPDLGLIFSKGKFKSEFVTVYVTNDPALLRILNLMVNNYGRHYVTFLELKSLLMVFNCNLRYYYNQDMKKMRKYDYDYTHKIDKDLWLEENFEKILKKVEFYTNIYIH